MSTDIDDYPFDLVWEKYIMPLTRETILTLDKKYRNDISEVDENGLVRKSYDPRSSGKDQLIRKKKFKEAYELLISAHRNGKGLKRNELTGRSTSIVCAVLNRLPFVEKTDDPTITLRIKFT